MSRLSAAPPSFCAVPMRYGCRRARCRHMQADPASDTSPRPAGVATHMLHTCTAAPCCALPPTAGRCPGPSLRRHVLRRQCRPIAPTPGTACRLCAVPCIASFASLCRCRPCAAPVTLCTNLSDCPESPRPGSGARRHHPRGVAYPFVHLLTLPPINLWCCHRLPLLKL